MTREPKLDVYYFRHFQTMAPKSFRQTNIQQFLIAKATRTDEVVSRGSKKLVVLAQGKLKLESMFSDAKQKILTSSHCDNKFAKESNRKLHEKIQTECPDEKINPLSCSNCEKKFAKANNLKEHERIHTACLEENPKLFSCSHCDTKFTEHSLLKEHERLHTEEYKLDGCPYYPYACPVKVTKESNLEEHLNTHRGPEPFPCTLCAMAYAKSGNLMRHDMSVHNGAVFGFTCVKCYSKTFRTPAELKEHKKSVHIKEKPYNCSQCDQKFMQPHTLRHHEKKSYSCAKCEKKFHKKDDLKAHFSAVHPRGRFDCPWCNTECPDKAALKEHFKTETCFTV